MTTHRALQAALSITVGKIHQQVRRAATTLTGLGVRPGDAVAVLVPIARFYRRREHGSTEHPTVYSARFGDPLIKWQFTDGKGGT